MSVENWSGSMRDKLIESAVTAGSFMIIDKLYYKSPMGMEWKKDGLSLLPLIFLNLGLMIAPKLGSSGYMAENTYLQPVVSGALYLEGNTFSACNFFSRLVPKSWVITFPPLC